MSNLIDRQALIAKFQAYYGHDNRSPYGGRSADAIAALSSIEGADTVDAELVRHGKWLDFVGDYTFAECSVCGEVYDPSDRDDKEHFDMFKQLYRFCPACGAKMDGGNTDATD